MKLHLILLICFIRNIILLDLMFREFVFMNKIVYLCNCFLVNNYPDPLYKTEGEYLQRITEMAGLEVETIKLEKSKKTRRK